MNITPDKILDALRHVIDPDLQKDLVSLGMIGNIQIDNDRQVSFTIILTTPTCPLKENLAAECKAAISRYVSDQLEVKVSFESQVTSFRKDKKDILPQVKNIIAVASGKGGVGKSTVAVNLAIVLAQAGNQVGLLDADIHGPSIPIMLGIRGKRPSVQLMEGKHYIEPIEQYGMRVISIGMLVDERQAVVWRGPMVASAIRQFITDVIWGPLDYLVIDLPPGTGDIHLSLVQMLPVTGAVIVTTPQQVALADARKALSMFRMQGIQVPVIGVVENMAYFTPAELPDDKYYIFGKNGGKKLADEFDVPFLAEIPLIQSVCEHADKGLPITISHDPSTSQAFYQLGAAVERQVAIINAQQRQQYTVETVS